MTALYDEGRGMKSKSLSNSLFGMILYQPNLHWYQQSGFLLVSLIALVSFTILILPSSETQLNVIGILTVIGVLLFSYAWVINLSLDRQKPEWLKNIATLSLLILHGWLFFQYSGANWKLVGKQFFDFYGMTNYWHILFAALLVTLKIGLGCFILVPLIGITLAIFRSFNSPILTSFIIAYIDIFRSIPDIVLIVVVYFALPYIGIQLESVPAVIVALSLLYGAYASEIFRAGIQSIQKIQLEASQSLGMTSLQTMRLIILPQAIRVVIPPFTSLLVGILKSTAIASVAATPELLTRGQQLNSLLKTVTPLVSVSIIYLVVLFPLVVLSNEMEKRFGKYSRKS